MILLYMRLFASTNKRFRLLLIVFLVFLGIVGLWTLFSTFLICLPVRGFWDHSVPATCRSFAVVWCLNAALQIVTDIVVVMTPIPTLARLRLPTRQKFALILVFALGFLYVSLRFGPASIVQPYTNASSVCAMSIIRLVRIIQLASGSSDEFSSNIAHPRSISHNTDKVIRAQRPSSSLVLHRIQRRHHLHLPTANPTPPRPHVPVPALFAPAPAPAPARQ